MPSPITFRAKSNTAIGEQSFPRFVSSCHYDLPALTIFNRRSAPMASDEETQTKLDAQASRPELELSELRRRENSLLPISRLPPEIFCEIFVSSTPDIYDLCDRRRMRYQAMDISHVCHSWRVIAIACPELWGRLHVDLATNAEVLTLALERAGRAPISINMLGWTGRSDPPNATSVLSKFIRERQSQCQHLVVYTDQHSFQDLFKDVSGSFDNLLSLKLGVDCITTSVLSEFLQHSSPLLRRLEIARPSVPCNMLQRFSQLTHVDIQQLSLSNTVITDLLAWLEQVSAGLQTLRMIERDFPRPTTEVLFPMGSNSIRLPNLEVFDLQSYSPLGSTMFEHLLSSISMIPITCTSRLRDITQDGERAAVLARRAYSGPPAPVLLELQSTGGILRAYDSLSTSQAERGDSKRFWTFLAENAVSLEILCITSYCVKRVAIADFLQCLRGSRGTDGSRQVPWPALQELQSPLPSGDYGGYARAGRDDSTTQLHPEVAYAVDLVDALRERDMSGSGSGAKTLAELHFTEYFSEPLDAEFALILSSAAAKVLWNVDLSRDEIS
ncbi:hypothetical protein NMY22_g4404 [Coprinellus aureogranulatus]|nr:hypothetical protein NMY22_g4404 [Coprinellus aureogranulatus]